RPRRRTAHRAGRCRPLARPAGERRRPGPRPAGLPARPRRGGRRGAGRGGAAPPAAGGPPRGGARRGGRGGGRSARGGGGGGGICWASAAAAPTSHAATHAASVRVRLMSLGSVVGVNIVNMATRCTTYLRNPPRATIGKVLALSAIINPMVEHVGNQIIVRVL